jgi:hypothetical protein
VPGFIQRLTIPTDDASVSSTCLSYLSALDIG